MRKLMFRVVTIFLVGPMPFGPLIAGLPAVLCRIGRPRPDVIGADRG